ncbi:MAG: ThuA domain-containing protein [Planctomycetes bacterium]|nr:ThuA domain-containing protein [Planctomycetota bacterium]
MKARQRFIQWVLCSVVFLFAVDAQAVTEQELQKMQEAIPNSPVVQPVKQRTMLVFSFCRGYKHSCIPYWDKALDIMGKKTGAFRVVHSEDMSVFSADSLKQFDVICFNNTTRLTPDDMQQKAIMDFIKSGKGIIGIHAATDNFYGWPEGAMMMGGVFKGHPWLSNGTWAVKIDDPDSPLMKPFEGKGFKINDEIYRTLPPQYSRGSQRVLMSLDMSDVTTKNAKGVTPDDMDTGISWIKSVGKGRLFYCSLGHNHHLTWNRPVLEHYLAGIQYAMGDLKVDDAPLGTPCDLAEVDTLIKSPEHPSRRMREQDALLVCYSIRAKESCCRGDAEEAWNVYKKLYNQENSFLIHAAALRGLVWSQYADSGEMLLRAVQDTDTETSG